MWSFLPRLVPFLLASSLPRLQKSGILFNLVQPTPESTNFGKLNGTTITKKKPVALYVPGIDGFGDGAKQYQFQDLSSTFRFYHMTVTPDDRSTFVEVVDEITRFVQTVAAPDKDDDVVLIGASAGGLLAIGAALKLLQSDASHASSSSSSLRGLVLVNPATSAQPELIELFTSPSFSFANAFLEQNQPSQNSGPVSALGNALLQGLPATLRTVPDDVAASLVNNTAGRVAAEALLGDLRGAGSFLSMATVGHRISKWLWVGATVVNERLQELGDLPTLVVAGGLDRVLPSRNEAERLQRVLPNCQTVILNLRGHFVLGDASFNLTEAIVYSKIDPLRWKENKQMYDPITDWKKPSKERMEQALSNSPLGLLRTAHSPIFISTDAHGRRHMGLDQISRPKGPLLFVGNHQLAAHDLGLLLYELNSKRGILPRGLAHPLVIGDDVGLNGRSPGFPPSPSLLVFTDAIEFGAVKVSPRNYYRLLKTGQDTLLFPGGIRESFCGDPTYPLLWREESDFIRTAVRFNATIIPFGAVGMVDSVLYLMNSSDTAQLPVIGQGIREFSDNVPAARYDEDDSDEIVAPSLFQPLVPARNYFLFASPIDTSHVDPKDREACEATYEKVRSEVRKSIDDLLAVRDKDPYGNTALRLVYERLNGGQAPTFSIDELNKHNDQ